MMNLPGINRLRCWERYFVSAPKTPGSVPLNSEAFFNGVVRGSMRNLDG